MRLFRLELKRILKSRRTMILLVIALLLSVAMAYLPISFEGINRPNEDGTVTEYFGFRELGVDHESFIKVKLENEDVYGKDHYASIFRLDCSIHKEVVTMKLYQLK